ncbi:MAG: hypothetical protein ACOCXM_05145, partial [Myxococcota bacterium]
HLNKRTGDAAIYRGGGSIGIIGAARTGLLVGSDPDDDEARILAVTKNNLAPMAHALGYRLVDTPKGVARVEWTGDRHLDADDLLARKGGSADERSALSEAIDFLRMLLESGPCEAKQVEREAGLSGVTPSTLRRAKRAIGVRSKKQDFEGGRWVWELPEGEHDAHAHLRGRKAMGTEDSTVVPLRFEAPPEARDDQPNVAGQQELGGE